jgi:hypothetical protein
MAQIYTEFRLWRNEATLAKAAERKELNVDQPNG